jgi:hypothetical protein
VRQPRVTIAISPQAMRMLERLARYGLYGRNVAGVAREILYAGMRKHLVERGEVRRGR